MDRSIWKRGFTILTVAPTVMYLLSSRETITALIWFLTFMGMIEWSRLKRHLKVELLRVETANTPTKHDKPSTKEYAMPVPPITWYIVTKSFACSLICPCAIYSPGVFHCGMMCYFIFWVLFTLWGQNKSERNARIACQLLESKPLVKGSPEDDFRHAELMVIATRYSTELFLSFCLEYFGFIWISGLSYSLLMYNHSRIGQILVITLLVSNWCNDIAALIIGRLRKHVKASKPLYPRISPNKSLDGAIAGILANGLSAAACIWYFHSELPWALHDALVQAFGLGLAFGILGVVGDLLESLFKRTAAIKDTGGIFPGHGGVIDRIDGLLIVYPVAYWIMWLAL